MLDITATFLNREDHEVIPMLYDLKAIPLIRVGDTIMSESNDFYKVVHRMIGIQSMNITFVIEEITDAQEY